MFAALPGASCPGVKHSQSSWMPPSIEAIRCRSNGRPVVPADIRHVARPKTEKLTALAVGSVTTPCPLHICTSLKRAVARPERVVGGDVAQIVAIRRQHQVIA